MGRQLVICLDGTGNSFSHCPTNIMRLQRSLPPNSDAMLSYYDQGVGTFGERETLFVWKKKLGRVLGLTFGWGLKRVVENAYRFLAQNYREGDQIFIFGFSRGAYSARSLAAVIRAVGLVPAHETHLFDYAWTMLAARVKKNKASPHGGKDDTSKVEPDFALLEKFKSTFGRKVPIHFLGLFDTVKSVGWIYEPFVIPYSTNNDEVRTVRHAISIDERRSFFRQNQWGARFPDNTDVKQVWFAGVHSDIGGGYAPEAAQLALLSHRWMLGEAVAAGLNLDQVRARQELEPASGVRGDALADMHDSMTGGWKAAEWVPQRVWSTSAKKLKWMLGTMPPFGRPRARPIAADALFHHSVQARILGRADWQLGTPPKPACLVQDLPLAWLRSAETGVNPPVLNS